MRGMCPPAGSGVVVHAALAVVLLQGQRTLLTRGAYMMRSGACITIQRPTPRLSDGLGIIGRVQSLFDASHASRLVALHFATDAPGAPDLSAESKPPHHHTC